MLLAGPCLLIKNGCAHSPVAGFKCHKVVRMSLGNGYSLIFHTVSLMLFLIFRYIHHRQQCSDVMTDLLYVTSMFREGGGLCSSMSDDAPED